MMDAPHNRLSAFLLNLECLSADGQMDAFVNEVMETFGRFDPPAGDRTHRWELYLHGISADGTTEEEAMANWKRLARQTCSLDGTEDDGFVTVYPPINQIGGAS